ncbi:conserved hypothetical protein [Vibrio rotiferianus]|uniref:sce7726 family protein n=2 Tax=Vibrio harveyi group TaxID=717610 RepID=UPI0028945D9E|nr:conserved hypothetical protein [Vibrio rotiferianus]
MPYFQDQERLLESELKALTLNHMLAKGYLIETDVISNEYLLRSSSRRADMVISKNGELWAFEIKSEADSLSRLNGQVDAYLKYFDKVIVVSASKHVRNVMNSVPKEVAVWEVRGSNIVVVQRGRKRVQKCSRALSRLLKLSKLKSLLKQYNVEFESKTRNHIELLARQNIPARALRNAVLDEFHSKYSLTSKAFFRKLHGFKVSARDLEELSVYKTPNVTRLDQNEELTKMLAMFDLLALQCCDAPSYSCQKTVFD